MICIIMDQLLHRMIKIQLKIACKKIDFVNKKIQISDLKLLEMILSSVKFLKKFTIQFMMPSQFLNI
jgi:hypothetical protein